MGWWGGGAKERVEVAGRQFLLAVHNSPRKKSRELRHCLFFARVLCVLADSHALGDAKEGQRCLQLMHALSS